ncbi:MAG: tyrosine-type recombinase/integrase, partial [Verrucomicrobiia bacterium]
MSDTELVKVLGRVARFRSPSTINTQLTKAGKKQFIAFVGYDAAGKKVRHSLGLDKDKAYADLFKINELIAARNFKEAANSFEVATDLEIRAAIEKLKGHNVTLTQAVAFFLQHHRPTAGNLTVEEGAKLFIANLQKRGQSKKYIHSFEKSYLAQFVKAYGKRHLTDISLDDAETFIYKTKSNLSSYSKSEFIGKMRVFFNGLADLKYYQKELNPFKKLKKPQTSKEEEKLTHKDRVLPYQDVYALLWHLEKQEQWDILTVLALNLFCGVRTDETMLMDWSNINFKKRKIEVTARIAKKRRRRIVDIPKNAMSWFTLCHQKMDGKWTKRTESGFKQKIKRTKAKLRKIQAEQRADPEYDHLKNADSYDECVFDFHTNCFRVSFASYSYRKHGAEKTAELMGHTETAQVLHTHYKELVDDENTTLFFCLIPMAIVSLEDHKPEPIKAEDIN